MRVVRFAYIAALAALAVLLGAGMALKFTSRLNPSAGPPRLSTLLLNNRAAQRQPQPGASTAIIPAHQPGAAPENRIVAGYNAQADVLELPMASTDFVGDWGGHIHSSLQRVSPDLVGTSPDRVSVIFGRRGDTVFMASELYSSSNQRLVHLPAGRILDSRLAVIEYESEDDQLDYICAHRFRLVDNARMSYRSTVTVYDLHSHKLMGIVRQRATLRRLLTLRQQLEYERPSRYQIPRAEISASDRFGPH
jgi:hypothetical protein